MANTEENSEEMQTEIDNLSYDLVIQILIHLSAEYIYDIAMLVCRRWYRIIHTQEFIRAHLAHHSTGLLVNDFSCPMNKTVFVAMRKGRIKVSKFSYKIKGVYTWATCNGLILECHHSKRALRVTNPVIMRRTLLSLNLVHKCRGYPIIVAILWPIRPLPCIIKLSIVAYRYPDLQMRCGILTMGVDKFWRDVCTQHLPPETRFYVVDNPIVTEGFIHWIPPDGQTHILTLNVDTETITQYPVPRAHDYEQIDKCYLSTGKSLSLFFACSDFSMDVWEMKSKTGEWSKMCSIDLEHLSLSRLSHVGWLKCREVVVFHLPDPTRVRIAYDVLTQEINLFNLGSNHNNYEFEIHTKSLVGLIGM